jgi:hypothetical protein
VVLIKTKLVLPSNDSLVDLTEVHVTDMWTN